MFFKTILYSFSNIDLEGKIFLRFLRVDLKIKNVEEERVRGFYLEIKIL